MSPREPMSGSPELLLVVAPMPPTVTNSGKGRSRGWWSTNRERKTYQMQLDELQAAGLIPRPPVAPLQRVSIASVMYLGGAMDDDNAMARHKPLLDWLKTRGYLADDRKKNIVWTAFPSQVVKRKDANYRIELTITPL